MFEIKEKDKDSNAKICTLKTRHGIVETPMFIPVASKTSVKLITNEQLYGMGVQAIISNAFLLYLNPGVELIKENGGIHKFSNFKKTIFTDSGGFQIFNETFQGIHSDKGILFRSPFDGKKILIGPEKLIEIQESLKSDVAMVLDDMPLAGYDKKKNVESTLRTHKWAEIQKKIHKDDKQLLFGIAQGGCYRDLRKKSIQFISNLDFDGIALGGLGIGEQLKKTYGTLKFSVKHTPKNKPLYLMGIGNPPDIIEAISLGVDIFDSCLPTRNARHNHLFSYNGPINIRKSKYKEDFNPIDKNCSCFVCKNHTRAYLHYLFRVGEKSALMLASYHNLFFIQQLIRESKEAIKEGKFKKFKNNFTKGYKK